MVFFFVNVVLGVIFDANLIFLLELGQMLLELVVEDAADLLVERFLGEADDLEAIFMMKGLR